MLALSEENVTQKKNSKINKKESSFLKSPAPADSRPASWHGSSALKHLWMTKEDLKNDKQVT